ncbi:MAG: hypothetical protein AAFX05_08990 [Planctomycetota bacterium]
MTLAIAVIAYGLSLGNMETSLGEIFSDVGAAFMLLTCVLLLLGLHRRIDSSAEARTG